MVLHLLLSDLIRRVCVVKNKFSIKFIPPPPHSYAKMPLICLFFLYADGQDILQPLFAEEKLSFAACGSASVTLTITRIRRVYNTTDAALICKVVS